jgi:hypothetical protein
MERWRDGYHANLAVNSFSLSFHPSVHLSLGLSISPPEVKIRTAPMKNIRKKRYEEKLKLS